MIFSFLTSKMFGLARGWWILVAIFAISIIGSVWLSHRDGENRNLGATVQRETDLRETVTRVEKANEARSEINNPGSIAYYNQCMRTARTPANCERFLLGREAN